MLKLSTVNTRLFNRGLGANKCKRLKESEHYRMQQGEWSKKNMKTKRQDGHFVEINRDPELGYDMHSCVTETIRPGL